MQLRHVLGILESKVEEFGSQAELARQTGVSNQYISDVLLGKTRPGKKILDLLNIEVIVTYELKDKSARR